MSDLSWMLAPVAVCLITVAALSWFGLHVLQRGVIFVDLALAQMAALGATFAVFLGHDPDEPLTLLLSLLFTMLGAIAFASLRQFEKRVPQEAIIGISYAVSAALGVLLIELASDPHGAEKVQHLMVGNIVWVQWGEVATAAAVVAVVGVVHAVFRERFLSISMDAAGATARGVRVGAWDLLFYMTFGAVLTSIVSIVGVLLVFSFLIIPSVVGRLFAKSIGGRLAISYGLGILASVLGVSVSYEHSTGPIIVAILGLALVTALSVVSVRQAASPVRQFGKIVGTGGLVLAVLWGFAQVPVAAHAHEHAQADDVAAPAATTDADPLSQLASAVAMVRKGDPAGLSALAALTQVDAPFIRMEAHDRLTVLAGDEAVAYDPMKGPDTGAWAVWAAAPTPGWQDRAAGLVDP
ncbi:MAG: metal ABC transporter permease [Oligoflexia bacterium]|nr:metal ABC transporter permease [Oligoflexia bacterium]